MIETHTPIAVAVEDLDLILCRLEQVRRGYDRETVEAIGRVRGSFPADYPALAPLRDAAPNAHAASDHVYVESDRVTMTMYDREHVLYHARNEMGTGWLLVPPERLRPREHELTADCESCWERPATEIDTAGNSLCRECWMAFPSEDKCDENYHLTLTHGAGATCPRCGKKLRVEDWPNSATSDSTASDAEPETSDS